MRFVFFIFYKHDSDSNTKLCGAAEARRAHNPEVSGSKPDRARSLNFLLVQNSVSSNSLMANSAFPHRAARSSRPRSVDQETLLACNELFAIPNQPKTQTLPLIERQNLLHQIALKLAYWSLAVKTSLDLFVSFVRSDRISVLCCFS